MQLHKQAQDAMASGDLKGCHQHCLAILKQDPGFADAWFLCGVIAAQNGLLDKAIQIFGNAIKMAPERAEYHAELGKYLLAAGELERALVAARESEALRPDTAAVLNTLATVLSHCGEHEAALVHFARAGELVKNGRSPQDERWLAEFYFNWAPRCSSPANSRPHAAAWKKRSSISPAIFAPTSPCPTWTGKRPSTITSTGSSPCRRRHDNHATGCTWDMPSPRNRRTWSASRMHSPVLNGPRRHSARQSIMTSRRTRNCSRRFAVPSIPTGSVQPQATATVKNRFLSWACHAPARHW
ncbi:MAG: tetratricopeptide repeat protein [Halioglobus sp.]|nr:tetratricopeptide repeat protein [Halioglobus sp.]